MTALGDEVRAILGGRAFAHLATLLPGGAPHSVPVWVGVRPDDRLVVFTQSGSRKARNIERDCRVALSAVDLDDPYRQCDLRGQVVERIDGEAALVIADELARKYTGRAFPGRSPATVVYVIAPERVHHVKLPFTHEA